MDEEEGFENRHDCGACDRNEPENWMVLESYEGHHWYKCTHCQKRDQEGYLASQEVDSAGNLRDGRYPRES